MTKNIHDFTQWLNMEGAVWNELASQAYLQQFSPGKILYDQGQLNGNLYIIAKGRIGITMVGAQGKEKALLVCEAGSLFGDCALTDNQISQERAIVVIPSSIYVIPCTVFWQVIAKDPLAARQTIRFLAKKAAVFHSQIEDLCLMDASERVKSQLLKFSQSHGEFKDNICKLNLRFTHQQMASMAGISRVMVSKIFSDMQKEGIISKQGGYMIINDITKLCR